MKEPELLWEGFSWASAASASGPFCCHSLGMKNCRTVGGSLFDEGYLELKDCQALGIDGSVNFKLRY